VNTFRPGKEHEGYTIKNCRRNIFVAYASPRRFYSRGMYTVPENKEGMATCAQRNKKDTKVRGTFMKNASTW
jgi:hypothetical protein